MEQCHNKIAYTLEQSARANKLFSAIVLAALDDAVHEERVYGNGTEQIARWARSSDGKVVLSCAGIDPDERVVQNMMRFVANRTHTSASLSRAKMKRSMEERSHAEA